MDHIREDILGVNISVVNLDHSLAICSDIIEKRRKAYVCVAPAHSLMDCQEDDKLKDIFNQSGLTTPDGMSVVWILKLKGNKTVSRVYGPDLLLSICDLSLQKGWSHFFYGSTEQVLKPLTERLMERNPGINIRGIHAPPVLAGRIAEEQKVIDRINHLNPDIVWVGLGSPKQEYWMYEHRSKITAPLLIGVGAAFDFLSGNKKQAPVWVQRSGFEWLFRLLTEPRRLWRRYSQYPKFVYLVALELVRLKVQD